LTIAIVILTVLVPFAEFFAVRLLGRGRTVIQALGMPWPDPVANAVQGFSVAIIVATVVLAVLGIVRRGSSRAAGVVAIVVTLAVVVPVFFVVLVMTFGDPA
jgi:hypothetical protein